LVALNGPFTSAETQIIIRSRISAAVFGRARRKI
jgi:hypothetical protein